jgi:hypothetical protein
MKNLLKISVGCLFIALALNVAFTLAQDAETPWLQLNCHNPANNVKLNPKWTVIVTSKKPSVKQIAVDRWEISFTP